MIKLSVHQILEPSIVVTIASHRSFLPSARFLRVTATYSSCGPAPRCRHTIGRGGVITAWHRLWHVVYHLQHLGDSAQLLEELANGQHPFSKVCTVISCTLIA